MIVILSETIVNSLHREALRQAPDEACGLLLGEKKDETIVVSKFIYSKNVTVNDPRLTFEIDPQIHFRCQKEARAGAPAIIGVWHSHPSSAAVPSKTDVECSVEGGWVWLITGKQDSSWNTAAFLTANTDPKFFEMLEIRPLNP